MVIRPLHPLHDGLRRRVLLLDLLEHATLYRGRRWDMDEPRALRRTTTSDVDEPATTQQQRTEPLTAAAG